MRKLTTVLLTGSALLLFTACGSGGGGGTSTPAPIDPMTQRQAVIIFYHIPSGMCADPYFQNEVIKGAESGGGEGFNTYNWLFREETLNVTCATYGKPNDMNDNGGCMSQDMAVIDPSAINNKNSCVVGFDADVSVALAGGINSVGGGYNKFDDITSNVQDTVLSLQ